MPQGLRTSAIALAVSTRPVERRARNSGKCQDKLIVTLAARHRLPAIYAYRSHVTSGGLISYASDQVDHFRRAAGYVDRQLVAGLGVGCGEFIASDFGRWSRTHGIPSGNEFPAYARRRQWARAAKFLACGEPDTEVFDQTGFPRFGPGKPWGRAQARLFEVARQTGLL